MPKNHQAQYVAFWLSKLGGELVTVAFANADLTRIAGAASCKLIEAVGGEKVVHILCQAVDAHVRGCKLGNDLVDMCRALIPNGGWIYAACVTTGVDWKGKKKQESSGGHFWDNSTLERTKHSHYLALQFACSDPYTEDPCGCIPRVERVDGGVGSARIGGDAVSSCGGDHNDSESEASEAGASDGVNVDLSPPTQAS